MEDKIEAVWSPSSPGAAFWASREPPPWAAAWSFDEHGAWVELVIEDGAGGWVVQRLRWIEPGTFLMGSPLGEPGRYPDEGPQHEVTISDGFWIFDTPCTQALWEAVMGANPSRFQSPERPVEQVSWEDVQVFLGRLNARVPGLALVLPSEAQWEYACRAGTDHALYSGPIEILGANDAAQLDPIAWYGGNSAVSFELDDGYDSSDWPDIHHAGEKIGTHPVKGKQPNAWGLYDMLGNVAEWTNDTWQISYDGAPDEDISFRSEGPGANRSVRGGSCVATARQCRCAFRNGSWPGYCLDYLGFRCVRIQDPPGP